MPRFLIIIALTSTTLACAGGSPTSPSSSLPRPNIRAVGNISWETCINGQCDGFTLDVTNDGPGCANTIGLRGTVTLREGQTVAKTTNWELTLGSQNVGVFQPGRILTAHGSFATLTDIQHHNYTADVATTSAAPVACQ